MRTKFTLLCTATAIAVAVFFTGALSNSIQAVGAVDQRHVVEIRDLEFTPKELSVAPGDPITWVNDDLGPHTVTADDESWDSGFISAQGRWQTVVRADMYASYFCRYHPSMTARLRIVRP